MGLLNTIINNPFGLLGASGDMYDGLSVIHKFGYNPDIANGSVPETVWSAGGLYPWSAFDSASTLTVASTNASDTGQLKISGLDENFYMFSETVTLNGTSNVTTSRQFKRVYRMSYADDAVGNITAKISTTTVAQIQAGKNQTLMAVYTVPAGYEAYLFTGDTSVNKGHDAQVGFYARLPGESFKIAHMAEVYENSYRYDFPAPLRIAEKTDLDVRVDEVENSGTRVTANFDLLLVRL
jgi:hypothetical protein